MRNISSAAKQSCTRPTSNKNPIVCFCCGSVFLAPVSNCRRVFDGDTWNLCTLGTGHYLAGGGGEGYYVWGGGQYFFSITLGRAIFLKMPLRGGLPFF